MKLEAGDVLAFDYSIDRPVNILINGTPKFRGQVVTTGRKKAFVIEEMYKVVE